MDIPTGMGQAGELKCKKYTGLRLFGDMYHHLQPSSVLMFIIYG